VRAAVVHDWFQGYHGSERVADEIRRLLVDLTGHQVDVFTFHVVRSRVPTDLADAIVRESQLSRIPGIRGSNNDPGRWRYMLPLMPAYFNALDLRGYDLVVSSSHAFAAGVRKRPDAIHICYCHTPIRYVWLPGTERGRVSGTTGHALRIARGWLGRRDLAASRRPDSYIANSTAVRDRIRRFYGRHATVIHPPVDTRRLGPVMARDGEGFLWVNRLTAYKQPLAVAESFRGLPYRLTMVGVGPLEADLRRLMPPNVELRGWLSDDELVALFQRSSGFVHVGEEDFGMAMVEALAAGVPVIALRRGGALDIVRDGIDGLLVEEASPTTIRAAVVDLARREWDPRTLAERADLFSRDQFINRFRAYLTRAFAQQGREVHTACTGTSSRR
jgi:glycosyltransferase involved in cell wall biosynthesis